MSNRFDDVNLKMQEISFMLITTLNHLEEGSGMDDVGFLVSITDMKTDGSFTAVDEAGKKYSFQLQEDGGIKRLDSKP